MNQEPIKPLLNLNSDVSSKPIQKSNLNNISIENFGYDTNDLNLEDLLEIFQGPVPLEGSIIIATTNKYEEIRRMCPALFRANRLTPVKCDYLDNKTLSEITKYFFNKNVKWSKDVRKKNIATCTVLEIAYEAKFNNENNAFEYFMKKMIKLLDHNPDDYDRV
jgi:hypothetical protein